VSNLCLNFPGMKFRQSAQTFVKVVSIAGLGVGGAFLTQNAYCDASPVENVVPQGLPGWSWNSNWDKLVSKVLRFSLVYDVGKGFLVLPDGHHFLRKDPAYRTVTARFKPGKTKKQEQMEFMDKVTPKAPRNLLLIRHGQYNLKGKSDQEKSLTELGRRQAVATGKRLKLLGRAYSHFIVSDMTRALETAEIIGKELLPGTQAKNPLSSFECDPLLREGSPIEPSPPTRTFHPELHYYTDGARIEAAFRKHFHRALPEQENESYEVVVCHANVIRYFCCRALQFPADRWLRISLGNGSITHVKIYPDGEVVLMSLGDNSHMPKDLLTTT